MISAVVAILAIASQGFLAVQGTPIDGDLGAICKGESIDRLTSGQVNSLAAQLIENENVECPEPIKEAIRDMAAVISQTSSDACSGPSVEAMTKFYANHLEDDMNDVPQSLENFALSHALRMSQRCKVNMVKVLSGEASKHVTKEDFDTLAEWAGKGREIDQLLTSVSEPGAFMLPSDLAALIPNFERIARKMAIDSSAGSEVQIIKEVCAKRFMPVYSELVGPVAALARAGFDYSDASIRSELSLSQEEVDKMDEWARVVFLCEVTNLIETYKRAPGDQAPDSVTVLDQQALEQVADQLEEPTVQIEPIHFEQARVSLDEIEPIPDEEIDELAINLRANTTPAQRLKEKLRKKTSSMVTDYLKKQNASGCMTCMQLELMDNEETSAVASDRHLCGRRRKSCGTLFKYLFIAAIISLAMMIFAGSG